MANLRHEIYVHDGTDWNLINPIGNDINNNSETISASLLAVKTAYDLANTANTTANNAIAKSVLSGAFDLLYSSAANTPARLAANTTTTKKFLTMTGDGTIGAAPSWGVVNSSDIVGSINADGLYVAPIAPTTSSYYSFGIMSSGTSGFAPVAGYKNIKSYSAAYIWTDGSRAMICAGNHNSDTDYEGGFCLWKGSYHIDLRAPSSLTANRDITFPNASGTVALEGHTHSIAWNQITNSGAQNISEGTSDFTDNTEIFSSYASNNGFADTNAPGVVYRRDAIKMYNYIKNKLTPAAIGAATSGHTHSTYVLKAGDTMSGNLTFNEGKYVAGGKGSSWWEGSKNALVFQNANSSGNTSAYYPIIAGRGATGRWSIGNLNDSLYISWCTNTNYNSGTNTTSTYSFNTSGNYSGNAANVTGTVAVGHGGTGATTAAAARANLATPYMVTETYPALVPTNASNNWIKIGTANTSYGILPSQSGSAGSGHNYIGTSSWYWKYCYVDEYYGNWKGTAIPVAKGGTGATTAAGARSNLGTEIVALWSGTFNSSSSATTISNAALYGVVFIKADVQSGGSAVTLAIPTGDVGTSNVAFQWADDANWIAVYLRKDGNNWIMTYKNGNSNGRILTAHAKR